MPFEAPNSVIMALRPYCWSQVVRGARLVDAAWEQTDFVPEKSLSRYSWMSIA